jgi:hypothetical protein
MRRIYHRGAPYDPLDCLDEVRDAGDPAFQQVTETAPAGQQVHGFVDLDVRGQHDDRGPR